MTRFLFLNFQTNFFGNHNYSKILKSDWLSTTLNSASIGQFNRVWWPTTVTAKPKTSRQKQNTSRQNQILHSKSKIALVLPWVFAFAVRYLVFAVKYLVLPWGLSLFSFAVRSLVLSWGILFLQWGFCFCREVFGFAVRYFVFAVRFLVLPWQLWALRWRILFTVGNVDRDPNRTVRAITRPC